MQDTIRSIELYHFPVPLKQPFVISLGTLVSADNVIVVIKTSEGLTGFGECSPFPTIHGETAASCMVNGKFIAKQLIGHQTDISAVASTMDRLIFGNTSIKSAFDIALHDIAARRENIPLYKYLNGSQRELYTDYTVSLGSPEKMQADAVKIVSDGFMTVKVKLGGKPEEDIVRIKKIREAIGMNIPLRIDANQGWKVEDAVATLEAMAPFNIQHCEEPVSRADFMSLPEIRSKSPVLIMCDESCLDDRDARRLLEMRACDLINVKLGKSSGIMKARKIVGIAKEKHVTLQAGGFLESRLGFSAAVHFALSSESIQHIDFDTPLMFQSDVVEGGMQYGKNGLITIGDDPGLGAVIPERVLGDLERIVVS